MHKIPFEDMALGYMQTQSEHSARDNAILLKVV